MAAGAAPLITTVAAANMRIEAAAGIEAVATAAAVTMAAATAGATSPSAGLCKSLSVFVVHMGTEAGSGASPS